MNQLEKMVNAIRTNLEKKRPEVYQIKEHPIDGCEEYVKKLYIDMLCVVAHYENEDAENQLKFIQRIHIGAGLTEPITENIKNAMELTVERFDEFLRQCRENSLENIFIVDCLLIACANGAPNGKQVEFLAEISEALGLGREHTGWLCDIAIAILEQDSDKYQSAYENIPDDKKTAIAVSVVCYLKEFVVGVLVDTDEMLWIYAREKTVLSEELFNQFLSIDYFTRKSIKIENYIIQSPDGDSFDFDNIEDIVLLSCEFKSISCSFQNINHILISNCIFDGFEEIYHFSLSLENVTSIDITNSLFKNMKSDDDEFSVITCFDDFEDLNSYKQFGTKMNISKCEFRNISSIDYVKNYKLIVDSGLHDMDFEIPEDKRVVLLNCIFSSCINNDPKTRIFAYPQYDSVQLQDCKFKNSCSEF